MTIKEIAKEAGVGVSTVSRYLNDGYVSEEKREIIAKIIEQNNYTRSDAAVTMRGKSKEIVIIVQRVSSNTTSRFLEGIIEQCENLGYTPTIHVVNFNLELQDKYLTSAINRNVYGIIVYSFTEKINIECKNLLVVGQKSDQFKSIYSNGKAVYKEMVSKVIANNKISKVEILGIDILDIEFINRVAGAIDAAKESAIKYNVLEEGFDQLKQPVVLTPGTYYVAMTDTQAYHLIALANAQNLVVGKDIFISGYGDYSTSKLLNLTTVDGLYEEVGRSAINSIVDQETNSIEISPVIQYRNSAKV